ncbi:MAG TPA: Npt1/Npt2 family nucleotide transporter [Vicinamibacterales bacterium]|nr:Npt1/Npt2 family nucleotide transporter [Vicinamibacterales bacterium]
MASPPSSTSEPRTLVSHPELRSHQSFPTFRTVGEPPKGWLERLLSVFADVRGGEGASALLLAFNVFLILAASYLIRNARTVLILTEGQPLGLSGSQAQAVLSGFMAILLIGVIPLYGWIASRVRRVLLITIVTLFFAMNLAVFAALGASGTPLAAVFYIWAGIFNVFVLAMFWGFANDLYTEGQGRRLFPMIGVGASVGALVGAESIRPLVRSLGFTPYSVMVTAGAVMLVALAVTYIVNRRETARADPTAAKANEEPLGPQGGFTLVLQDRYLTWIFILMILVNVVNSTGNYLLYTLVETYSDTIADPTEQKNYVSLFQGSFDALVSRVTLVLQLFATSRLIRFLGVRGSLFVLPLIALVNYSIIAVAPILAIIRVGKVLENSGDYSIQNTVRQALFLPTSREAKYKAKAAIDTFGQRSGDVLAAVVVIVGGMLGFALMTFALINVALTAAWLWVAGQIAREHRKKTV